MRIGRRKRRETAALPAVVYHAPRTAIGCRFCNALRELLSFDWAADEARYNALMDEGECYPAVPNVPFVMVTLGNDGFSQFDFAAPVNAFPANYVSAMWFRVADMEPAFQPS